MVYFQSFNSTLVRLIQRPLSLAQRIYAVFQFHTGTINP